MADDYQSTEHKPIAMLACDVAALDTPPIRSYPTGLPDLDALIGGGISTRQVLSVLGPPGAGKSAFAVSLCVHIEPTLPILYASTELEQHELMARFAGHLLGRPWSAAARGHVPKEWITNALADRRFYLLGSELLPRDSAKALALIEAEATAIRARHEVPPTIVIDYLQDLARGGGNRDPRAQVGDLATDVRAMTQRLDCPTLAVSSVARTYYSPRRAAELRELDDPTVYLAAAKESGDVDYASAVVLFLDVDEDRSQPERAVRIAVAKSRHGETGFAGAMFAGASGRFRSEAAAVSKLSSTGRTEQATSDKLDEREQKALSTIVKMHADGERELCTATTIKGRWKGGNDHLKPTLDRLVHRGTLIATPIERIEAGKTQKRVVYDLPVADKPPTPEQTEMDVDHHGGGLH